MKRLKCLVGPRARRASGRALALLVVLAMALAVAPMAVFAATGETGLDSTKSVYKIINVMNDLSLGVTGGSTNNSADIISWEDQNLDGRDTAQLWQFETIADHSSWRALRSVNSGRYMEVDSANSDKGHKIVQYKADNVSAPSGPWQEWYIVPVKKNGDETYYKIVNCNSGLAITFLNQNHGETATQQPYEGTDGQLWKIIKVTDVETDTDTLPTERPVYDLLDLRADTASKILDWSDAGVNTNDTPISAYVDESAEWTWGLDGGTQHSSTDKNGDNNTNGVNFKRYALDDEALPDVKNVNLLQFYTQYANAENGAPLYIQKTKKETVEAANKLDYYIYEFYPRTENVTDGAIALYDAAHNLISSLNLGIENGGSYIDIPSSFTKFEGGEPQSHSGNGKIENNGVNGKNKLRLLIENKENSHEATWYYRANELANWMELCKATYSGNTYGLGKIVAKRYAHNKDYGNIGIGDFRVYAGSSTIRLDVTTRVGMTEDIPTTYHEHEIKWENTNFEELVATAGTKTLKGTVDIPADEVDDYSGQTLTYSVELTLNVNDVKDLLTHYYDFNGDLADEKGTTTPSLVGDAKIVDNRLLIPTVANTSHVKISGELISNTQDEATVSAWVRATSQMPPQTDGRGALFGCGTGASGRGFFSPMWDSKGYGVEFGGANQAYCTEAIGQLSMNGWHYIVLTLDADGDAVIYDNGNKLGSTPVNGRFGSFFGVDNYIGWSGYNNLYSLAAYYDDFKVYSVALTENEIKKIYDDEKAAYAADIITVEEPKLAAVGENQLALEYKVDFGDALGVNTYDTVSYSIDIEYLDESGEGQVAKTEQVESGSLAENAVVDIAIAPDNSNIPFKIVSKAYYGENGANVIASVESSVTTLYEELIKDLASGGYDVNSKINPDRLAAANAIIAKGGLESLTIDSEVRGKIMQATGNKVEIIDPFKSLGIGFLYKADGIYVGNNPATGAEEGVVYQSITINDGTATLGDKFGVEPDEAETVTISLDEIDHVFVEGLMDIIDDAASGETEFVEEI